MKRTTFNLYNILFKIDINVNLLERGIGMKYYNQKFLKSELFYKDFYLPFISLTEYIIRENLFRKLGSHETSTEIVKQEYFSHCQSYFKEDILFYTELSKFILNLDGTFKSLDEYIFFKLRYYGTKFLDISNESINFFEEERKKFKENKYEQAIVTLSQFCFHDANAVFDYEDEILTITYRPGIYEEIFEFHGVIKWEKKEFMKREPTLIIEELYEETQGIFVYNTLWNHLDVSGKNYSELSISFTKLIKVK